MFRRLRAPTGIGAHGGLAQGRDVVVVTLNYRLGELLPPRRVLLDLLLQGRAAPCPRNAASRSPATAARAHTPCVLRPVLTRRVYSALSSRIFRIYAAGPLGFLAADALRSRSESNSSGFYAIQDQRAALQWVQRNIGAFGGDKDNVVLWGESAGSTSVTLHLVLERSWGLFHKVVMESGAFNSWTEKPWAHSSRTYSALAQRMFCNHTADGQDARTVACLVNASSNQMLQASDSTDGRGLAIYDPLPFDDTPFTCLWSPPVDGVELTDTPLELLRRGHVAPGVGVLLGTNRDEGTYFTTTQRQTSDYWHAWMNHTFGSRPNSPSLLSKLLGLYTPSPSRPHWGNTSDDHADGGCARAHVVRTRASHAHIVLRAVMERAHERISDTGPGFSPGIVLSGYAGRFVRVSWRTRPTGPCARFRAAGRTTGRRRRSLATSCSRVLRAALRWAVLAANGSELSYPIILRG